jgi:hypothetical protein
MATDTISILDRSTFLVSDRRGDVEAPPRRPARLELRIEADADFADLFEVKDSLAKKGETYRRIERIELREIPGRWGSVDATTLKEAVS